MILENNDLTQEEMLKVLRAMQVRMRNVALHHLDSIGPRTLRALQNLDLFQGETTPVGDELDLAVLNEPNHPSRQNISDGPLLLYLVDGDEPERIAIELPTFILSESQDVRKAVLKCLDDMLAKDPMLLTPKTSAIVKEQKEALLSENQENWRPASVAVYDAFYDDILFALNATRQCLKSMPVFEELLNFYAPKIIHPTVSSLDSISLSVSNLEKDHKSLLILLSEMIINASNLSELCSAYFVKLGFLPLAPPYGLATAVSRWLDSNSDTNVWQEVWAWAQAESSPLSFYHACSVFVLLPGLIPDGKLPALWKEIITIVKDPEQNNSDAPDSENWALRRDLARHYTFHFEARLPDNDGGNIGCFAWWFAEQVASIFPTEAIAAKFYREDWVKPALELSNRIWLTASAPVQYSFLRYITLTQNSPWAIALMTLMGEQLESLAPGEQGEEIQTEFNKAIVKNAIFSLPFPLTTPSDPTFVQECSFAKVMNKWAQYQGGEAQQGLQDLISNSKMIGDIDGLCNALKKLDESNLPDQLAVCLALKTKVFIDPTIAENVWEIVSDVKWRKNVLGKMEGKALDSLIESLSMLLINNKGEWFSYLPHYIAELCEKESDAERRKNLFLYVIHLSLAADNVSAVCRLTRGDQKEKYVEYVKEYRSYIESRFLDCPPWVAGKVRGLLASMYIH